MGEVDEAAAALARDLGAQQLRLAWTNPLAGRTYRLRHADADCYLKVSPLTVPASHDLTREAERIDWIAGRLPVPEVVGRGRTEQVTWMLSRELPGEPASDPRWGSDPVATARTLGRGIAMFHHGLADAVPDCPWSGRIADRLAAGRGADEAQAMARQAPPEDDLVVAHGDLCAPNVLLSATGDVVTGFVDLGKLGVADRAADLGCHAWSLDYNGLGEVIEDFLAAYGYTGDPEVVAWYQRFYSLV